MNKSLLSDEIREEVTGLFSDLTGINKEAFCRGKMAKRDHRVDKRILVDNLVFELAYSKNGEKIMRN